MSELEKMLVGCSLFIATAFVLRWTLLHVMIRNYILYLKQRDNMRQIRKEKGREYLVCAYFLKTDACVVGSVTLLEPPQIGQVLLLGHKDDPVICIGKVTDVVTIAEPDPEHKAVWVMLDQGFMYTQLMEQVERWQRKNRIHPRV